MNYRITEGGAHSQAWGRHRHLREGALDWIMKYVTGEGQTSERAKAQRLLKDVPGNTELSGYD